MALIKCPECEQSVSDKASKCPKCGYPIHEYLSGKAEEAQTENDAASVNIESSADIQQASTHEKSKKKLGIALLAVCVIGVLALVVLFAPSLFAPKLIVEDITISQWRLTDSSDDLDYYEGIVTSEQKKPFIAVIAHYENSYAMPEFVYMEDGIGVIETKDDTDEDPSIKYIPIGYLGGTSVDISDIKFQCSAGKYDDFSYSQGTTGDVIIRIEMKNSKSGLLVFDIIDETNNEIKRSNVYVVKGGEVNLRYTAELPYKARGVDISIVPKFFCESTAITQDDYVIEKAFTAEKDVFLGLNYYLGRETLAFPDYTNGIVFYTEELIALGLKECRNDVIYRQARLYDGKCILITDYLFGEGEAVLMPKYEFNIISCITWTPLEKETN